MKKLLFLTVFFALGFTAMNAQIIRTEELEKYAKEKYGDKWKTAAANIASSIELDKNMAITYVQVIEAPGKSKEELYVTLNHWYTMTFNDANSVIKLNDKELGVIIGEGYLEAIAGDFMSGRYISIKPIIKSEIKDEKVRVTYTVPFYIYHYPRTQYSREHDSNVLIDKSYPFSKKDVFKKFASKALVMSNAYSNVNLDKIEAAIKEGMIGNEGDDW